MAAVAARPVDLTRLLRARPTRLAWGLGMLAAMLAGIAQGAKLSQPGPVIIHVAPGGHDVPASAGVPAGPVATLGNAMDLVATLRTRGGIGPITVDLAAGTFRLDHALHIGAAQAGAGLGPLIIRGAPDGSSVITGSVALEPLTAPLPAADETRLPPGARSHIHAYRLPQSALTHASVGQLSLLRDRPTQVEIEIYDAAGALAPARWPDTGWSRLTAGSTPPGAPTFTIDGAPAAQWAGEPDLWADGYFHFDWLFETVRVDRVDPASGLVTLKTSPNEGVIKPGARVRISHALSALDQPGTWWRDWDRGLLLAWPRAETGPLELAVADRLIEIENAHDVRLENLTLDHARGDALWVHDSTGVVVAHSTIAWVAGRGAVFERASRSGLVDCTVRDTGRTGVRLVGGDRATLTPSNLSLRESRISGYGRLALTQQAGAEIDGVGVAVEGTLFHDAGAAALIIHGNDHRIVGNELTRLLRGVTDDGAIYAGRDWTARGTLIAHNYLHDIHADPGFEDKGVYLDDEASGFTIRDNLFVRVDQPVFIGGGRDNDVEGNVFVASSPAIHVDSRGETWAAGAIRDPTSELRAALAAVPVTAPLWRARYPTLAGILADEPSVGKNNQLRGNTFVLSTPFDFSDGGHRDRQIVADNHGPEGLALRSGADLARLAAESRDPRVFAGLLDAAGKPVGLDLGDALRGVSAAVAR